MIKIYACTVYRNFLKLQMMFQFSWCLHDFQELYHHILSKFWNGRFKDNYLTEVSMISQWYYIILLISHLCDILSVILFITELVPNLYQQLIIKNINLVVSNDESFLPFLKNLKIQKWNCSLILPYTLCHIIDFCVCLTILMWSNRLFG